MPIVQTPVTTATAMSRSAIEANLSAIENYLRGNVDAADLSALIGASGRVNEQNMIVYAPKAYEIGPSKEWSVHSGRLNHRLDLDDEGLVDFQYYGSPFFNGERVTVGGVGASNIVDPCGTNNVGRWQDKYVFERLGNVPESVGHIQDLKRMVYSWNNWRWNFPAPAFPTPAGIHAYLNLFYQRFPDDEYWDSWKTVPNASTKIYVPGPCMLFVQGWARGTWNGVGHLNGPIDKNWDLKIGPGVPGGTEAKFDPPVLFRLFVDQAHKKNDRPFNWFSNGNEYKANWAPIQTAQEVGLGTRSGVFGPVGHEVQCSTWPRNTVRIASEIFIPAAGYYTLSLRFNSLYFAGWAEYQSPGVYHWKKECAPSEASTTGSGPNGPTWGLPLVSRWEASGIQAIAQLGRTAQSRDASDSQFVTP